jgi:hypothetical protein
VYTHQLSSDSETGAPQVFECKRCQEWYKKGKPQHNHEMYIGILWQSWEKMELHNFMRCI